MLTAGELDLTFGIGGKVLTDMRQGSNDYGTGVATYQSDGKVVMNGFVGSIPESDFADFGVVRYNSDGSRDTSFGIDGIVTVDFGGVDVGYYLAVDSSDHIVVVGRTSQDATGSDFAVARLTTQGELDSSFGTNGKQIIKFGVPGLNTSVVDVAVDSFDRVLVSGYDALLSGFVVTRLTTAGELDSSFDSDGKQTINFHGYGLGIAVDSIDRVLLAGTTAYGGATGQDFEVARLTSNGELDLSFGTDGMQTIDFGGSDNVFISDDGVGSLAVDSADRVLVAGSAGNSSGGNDFAVARLTTSGALDLSFGTDGKQTVDFGNDDYGNGVAVDLLDRVLLAGYTYQDATGNDFAVARLTTSGELDLSFDMDGKQTIDFGGNDEGGTSVAVDSAGRVLVAGNSYQEATGQDFALARLKSDAILVNGTTGNDIITIDPGTQPGTLKVTVNNIPALDNLVGPVTIDGGNGSDTYTVNFGSLQSTGLLKIADTGTIGSDTLTVNGTAQADTLAKAAGFIKWRPTGDTAYRQEMDFNGMEGVTLNAGAGNDTIQDPNSGNFLILGGDGDDIIIVQGTVGTGVIVDGGNGSDTYIVNSGNLQGPVTLTDTGASGTDIVTVNGTFGTDTFTQTNTGIVANGGTINVGAGMDALTVDGGGGSGDTFTVIGTPTITPTVQGVSDTIVQGTSGNDTIVLSPVGNTTQITVKLNGKVVGTYQPTGRMIVHGLAGDDDIQVTGNTSVSMWLYGDGNNDRLKGGAGNDVLMDGDGDDLLVGGSGRDLLIGGTGADRLVGDADDDILIAGFTLHDINQMAIAAVMAEWTSTRSYSQRVANISNRTIAGTDASEFGNRVNGGYFLIVDGANRTVLDDNAVDLLTGSSGQDWFLFNADGEGGSKKDKVTDLKADEFALDLNFINGV